MASSIRPKLERRNAKKNVHYNPPRDRLRFEARSLPLPPHSPTSSFVGGRDISRDNPKSFRVVGIDSEEEIEQICRFLGIPSEPDAFGISQAAWDSRKALPPSLFSSSSSSSFSSSYSSYSSDGSLASRGTRSGPLTFFAATLEGLQSSRTDDFAGAATETLEEKPEVKLFPAVGIYRSDGINEESSVNVCGFPAKSKSSSQPRLSRSRSDEGPYSDVDSFAVTKPRSNVLAPPPPMNIKRLQATSTQDLLRALAPDTIEDQIADEWQMNENGSYGRTTESQSLFVDKNSSLVQGDSGNPIRPFFEELSRLSTANDTLIQERNQLKFTPEKTLLDDKSLLSPEIASQESAGTIPFTSWRKLDILGSGSFGTVYEGVSNDGCFFAVKEVSLSDQGSRGKQCILQLEQEIMLLSQFQHENIVRYIGTQREQDKLYIFLELLTKGSLASHYVKYPLFESQIRSYTKQILRGLRYLHDKHIVHRDIKCANILVDANGKVKLADFGLAKEISKFDELKSCKGSAYWMAPEVIDPRKAYWLPADIWSLGCTVLEMMTGRPPFGDLEWYRALWKVGHGEAPPVPETISVGAQDFIKKCLEVDPTKRPTADDLLQHPFLMHTDGSDLSPVSSDPFVIASTVHTITEQSSVRLTGPSWS